MNDVALRNHYGRLIGSWRTGVSAPHLSLGRDGLFREHLADPADLSSDSL